MDSETTTSTQEMQSRLLALPTDIRLQIWHHIFSQTIHVGHVFSSHPSTLRKFRSALCTASTSDKANSLAPNGKRSPFETTLSILLTCKVVYAEASKVVFEKATLACSDRIILERFCGRLAPWQQEALRTITLCDIYHQLTRSHVIDRDTITRLAHLRHLNLYVELVGNDYTDDDTAGRTVNSESNRDHRLMGVYGFEALDLRSFEMWTTDKEYRKRPGDFRTAKEQAPWIDRVRNIVMGTLDPRVERPPADR
ncbi:hypothetical protein LTR95_003039 [Oleoguttula sp. CCFEE 5521]